MRRAEDVRGVDCVWDPATKVIEFECEGDPIPDANWEGPSGYYLDGTPKPLDRVGLPDNFQETGLADAVAEALTAAPDTD